MLTRYPGPGRNKLLVTVRHCSSHAACKSQPTVHLSRTAIHLSRIASLLSKSHTLG